MFGAIIGAATSLIAGRRADRRADAANARADAQYERELAESREERATRIQTMVADAKAAGINPLTALRSNGGSQGYNVTHGGLTSSNFLAEAIGNAGSILGQALDPMNRRRQQLELKLLERDLAAAQGGAGVGSAGAVQPVAANAPLSARARGPVTPVPNAMEARPGLSWGAFTPASGNPLNHDVQDFSPDTVSYQDTPVARVMTMPDGSQRTIYVGYEWDELLTGAAIVGAHNFDRATATFGDVVAPQLGSSNAPFNAVGPEAGWAARRAQNLARNRPQPRPDRFYQEGPRMTLPSRW